MIKSIYHFESANRGKIIWFFRILVAAIFVVSAITKLLPIELFEKQLVEIAEKQGVLNGFTNWCSAPIWARVIVIIELFLGFSLLIPFYQRTFTIPLALAMLLVFIGHLILQIVLFGNDGNCGCMGQFLPMTPLQAIFKNSLTIVVLIYLYIQTKSSSHQPNPVFHFLLLPAIAFTVFLFFPNTTNCYESFFRTEINKEVNELNYRIDTLTQYINNQKTLKGKNQSSTDSLIQSPVRSAVSEFHNFKTFIQNGKSVSSEIDKGKSIVCVFNPDCDHCMEVAKKLGSLQASKFAKVHFLFHNLDVEDKNEMLAQCKDFMTKTGSKALYTVIEKSDFMQFLANQQNPPRLSVLHNGTIIYDYLGTGEVNSNKIKKLKGLK